MLTQSSFPFLSLPLELRDQIYTHLFPSTGLRYTHDLHAKHYSQPLPRSPSHLSLFLTSHQIHHEAQRTLFLTTHVLIETNQRPRQNQHTPHLLLHLALRAFPPSQACMLTRLQRNCYVSEDALAARPVKYARVDPLFAMWTHVVTEACIIGEHFPRVRRLDVTWRNFAVLMVRKYLSYVEDCDVSNAYARAQRVQDVALVLVQWVQGWERDENCIPPAWLRIEVDDQIVMREENLKRKWILRDALLCAHTLLAGVKQAEREDLDSSGRKWLEDLSTKRKRSRHGWYKE